MSQQFQSFQPVRVNNEALADHGRAGTVRSSPYTTGSGKTAATVIDVQLDATADHAEQLVQLSPDDIAPLF